MCRGVSHTPFTAANMPIQRWYYVRCQHFISAHIRAYAIRPYTYSVEIRASLGENTITNRPIQSSCYHRINRKYVGAYRIRPPWRRTCPFNDGIMFAVNISFPLTSGRMRYAPTPVRLKSWPNTINHYTRSVKILAVLGDVLASFSLT